MQATTSTRQQLLQAMAGHSHRLVQVAVVTSIIWVVLACIGQLLIPSGEPLSLAAQAMQWLDPAAQATHVQSILRFWQASSLLTALAYAFVVIDSVLFVPAYALLFTGLRARWACRLPSWLRRLTRWRRWRWLVGATVLVDWAENAITALAIQGVLAPKAWQIATLLKWLLVGMMLATLLLVALLRLAHAPKQAWLARWWAWMARLHQAARALWLYLIPLLMLLGGVAMIVLVPQTREIIGDLGNRANHAGSRITTLVLTCLLLVVWLTASGAAFALVGKASEPMGPLQPAQPNQARAAVLAPAHQWLLGIASVVTMIGLLTIMSAQSSGALSLFIAAGCAGIWVMTARACMAAARLFELPLHTQATPVKVWPVALMMMAYALVLTARRLLPQPDEDALRPWGVFKKPDGVWRFNAQLVDSTALHLLIATAVVSGFFLMALYFKRRGPSRNRPLAHVGLWAGLVVWVGVAWWTLGGEMVIVHVATIYVASTMLWILTHRRTLADYEAWRVQMMNKAVAVIKKPAWLVKALPTVLNLLFGTVKSNLGRTAASLLVLFFLLPHTTDTTLSSQTGTLAVVFAALAFWGLLATWLLVVVPMRRGLGNWTLAPLAWLAVVGLLPTANPRVDHATGASEHPFMSSEPKSPASLPSFVHAAVPTLHTHFQHWRQLLPDGKASPTFVVSAAGGGLRAAYWTATLLAEMDDRSCGQFGRHVLLASGVSGGSLGLALYAAQRRVWQQKPLPERCQAGRTAQMRRVLSGDFIAPIAASLLFADAPMALVPYFTLPRNRMDALTLAIQRRWQAEFADAPEHAGLLGLPMRQAVPALAGPSPSTQDKAQAAHPLLYLNATAVETGRRSIASNVSLGTIPADPYFFEAGLSRGTTFLTEQKSLLDVALNSARFPVVSPAGSIHACSTFGHQDSQHVCRDDPRPYGLDLWGHVVDGGYFENSGLETLEDALQALRLPGALSVHGSLPPFFLIAISNDKRTRANCPNPPTPRFAVEGADPTALAVQAAVSRPWESGPERRHDEAVGGLRSALETLLTVREGRARLELSRATQRFGCPHVLEWALGEFLTPKDDEPALGWMLSAKSMRRMDEEVRRYADAFPFDLAACPKRGGGPARGQLGGSEDLDTTCTR